MLGARLIRGNKRQIDLRLHGRGQFTLGLLRRFLQSLQRHGILFEINPLLALELVRQPINDPLIEVVSAEMRVTVGGLDLEHPVAQF